MRWDQINDKKLAHRIRRTWALHSQVFLTLDVNLLTLGWRGAPLRSSDEELRDGIHEAGGRPQPRTQAVLQVLRSTYKVQRHDLMIYSR